MFRRIGLIIGREYKSKVRKKSFWIMAVLGPVLLALGMIVPIWFGMEKETKKAIEVVDESNRIGDKLISTPDVVFVIKPSSAAGSIKEKNIFYATLFIPANGLDEPKAILLYSRSRVAPEVKVYIENNLSEIIFIENLKKAGLDKIMETIPRPNVVIKNVSFNSDWNEEQITAARYVAGLFACVLILFFIVIYGGQVMRGVMEEKMNRIVEVMVSTVKPFELMMGKITGIALVSLTQFLIWILLTSSISFVIQMRYGKAIDAFSNENIESTIKNNPELDVHKAVELNEIVTVLDSLDIALILIVFLLYFVLGYLLYASLFAGIGSLVDSESDTQQFVLPLIAPLLFVMFFATAIMDEPHGPMAFWLSVIPFTSPLTMMLRIPFGVPVFQLLISLGLIIVSFLGTTWLSAKVYRTGILMYGKKVTPFEIWKMLKA